MPTINEVLQQGWQLHQAGHIDASRAALPPGFGSESRKNEDAFVYLGIALFDQRQFDESVAAYREAIAIRPERIRSPGTISATRCVCLAGRRSRGMFRDRTSPTTRLSVGAEESRHAVGLVRRNRKGHSAGTSAAWKFDPDNAELHRNLGVIHLLLGTTTTAGTSIVGVGRCLE